MEYTSCIRVRGVPILPPLMTEDLRSEMNYYKKLALSVEERLSRRRSILGSPETARTSRKSSKTSFRTEETLSDDETLTKSTDLHKYLGNPSDSSETSPEGKPRVPTSLDVVPFSLEPLLRSRSSEELQKARLGEDTHLEPKKLVRQGSYTLDTPSPQLLAHIENKIGDYVPTRTRNSRGPKNRGEFRLSDSRQEWTWKTAKLNGSLDSLDLQTSRNPPKPRARKFERSKSTTEVKPPNFSPKIRDFPPKNGKIETTNRDFIGETPKNPSLIPKSQNSPHNSNPTNSNGENGGTNSNFEKSEENSNGGNNSNSGGKSPRFGKGGKNPSIENGGKNSNTEKGGKNSNIENGGKNLSIEESESPSSIKKGGKDSNRENRGKNSNFENGEKKTGSLNNLLNSTSPGTDRMTKSLDTTDFETGTSERLLGVFREIQRTHDRQMADLISRQQKEQMSMQQAFEKQQLLLLEQIDRTFPGVSIMDLVRRVGGERAGKDDWREEDFESSLDSDGSASGNLRGWTSPDVLDAGRVSRQLFPGERGRRIAPFKGSYDQKHIQAVNVINAHVRGYLVRRLMKTSQIISLKNTYREALHCMLKLTVDAPLELPELNFHKRLQLQCDAASMNIVELFSQSPSKRMEIISHDREHRKSRSHRPTSARSSISFATQRTLARKKLKELGIYQLPESNQSTSRTRCQTWTSNNRDKKSPGIVYRGIKRSTSAGAVRKPWR